MDRLFMVLLTAAAGVCALILLVSYFKTKKTMMRLNQMLDAAIDGSFTEHSFDESLLSAVESRMNQFLSASAVSARNLSLERRKVQQLLADISHQTKTPIANILLYAQLLEEQKLSGDSGDCAAAIGVQAEKLGFLITSLVKLSRLETGILTLHPAVYAVAPMIKEAAGQFRTIAEQKGIVLKAEPAEVQALFDVKWTTEALCNLIDNAVKYTQNGGSIQISVKEYELFLRIDVSDTGIGISEEDSAKVFGRFYRCTSAHEKEGVGIGLYLVRQILAEQGGYVKVKSVLGKGSTFSIFLPRRNSYRTVRIL